MPRPNVRQALVEIAGALQPALLLATNLRRELGERGEDAVALEASLDRAVRVLRRLCPQKRSTP